MPLVLAALFVLTLAGVLVLVLERARPPRPFDWPAFRAELERAGIPDPLVPLRPSAAYLSQRRRGGGFDLVVTLMAKNAAGRPYADLTTGEVATETRRIPVSRLELSR